MIVRSAFTAIARRRAVVLSCIASAALAACGGGSADDTTQAAAADTTTADTASAASTDVAAMAAAQAVPTFHMAPAELDEPADVDAGGTNVSAQSAPRQFAIDPDLAGLSTARLTPDGLAQAAATLGRARAQAASTQPKAVAIVATVFTPAQIRAAYGLPALPATGASLSAAAAAALGAGQTIYVVDAYDHPNAFADLAKFSTKFGLPGCTRVTVTSTTALPLAAAAKTGCTFAVVSTDANAAVKPAAPAYSADWAPEIALDVQWAHAVAPLARIVLVETASASSSDLLGGVQLANKLGAGVVSMSFGAPEAGWVLSTDASFAAAGMSYVAASGDGGAQVNWPAVSPRVLAVGGTSLAWSGAGTRYEAAWSGAGGGVSAVEPAPAWQSAVRMPGLGVLTRRGVSDVAFNADPSTGQYVALTAPNASTTSWNAYGGTSIGAPQWAGLLAVSNAQRALAAKAALGDVHALLYASIAGSTSLADVSAGNDGSCTTCAAAAGYDQPTGWGTPNAGSLLPALLASGAVAVNHAPVLANRALSARANVAFSAALAATDADGDAITYTMTGAPSGLSLSAAGVLSWSRPVRGGYALKVTPKDARGLAGAVATVTLTVTN